MRLGHLLVTQAYALLLRRACDALFATLNLLDCDDALDGLLVKFFIEQQSQVGESTESEFEAGDAGIRRRKAESQFDLSRRRIFRSELSKRDAREGGTNLPRSNMPAD
jgi:hypothetical protein